MARAMPVISISRPRNTNNGTASSTRLLMPSSMRETMMVRGARVAQVRKASVAAPKAKPIGTPSSTAAASRPTKKKTRFQLPMARNAGAPSHSPAASTASAAPTKTTSVSRHRARWMAHVQAISAQPTGMAAARTMLDQPSAGVSMNHSSIA